MKKTPVSSNNSFKQKPLTTASIQKPQKTPPFQSTLTKKLSLALEEKLNIEDFPENVNNNEENSVPLSANEKEKKHSLVLEKAKALIEKSKTMTNSGGNPNRKYKTIVPKDDAFLTSIHVLSENLPIKNVKKEEPEEEVTEELNEDEMLKNLWLDNYNDNDDLAELRKMINRTKKNISDYASELYHLKNGVNDVKLVYDDLGYKVKNNDVLYEMDKVFNEYMPNGNKNSIFSYEFYDDPSRNKEKKNIQNQKANPSQGNLKNKNKTTARSSLKK